MRIGESSVFEVPSEERRSRNLSGWDTSGLDNECEFASVSIFMMETQVMGVEGAPTGSRLLYYPVSVRKCRPPKRCLDSGASVNCIDAELADRAGGVITRKAKRRFAVPRQETSRCERESPN